MERLRIRPATMADCAGIQAVHRDGGDPWSDGRECRAWVQKRLNRDFYIQIAELNGKVVGHGEWLVTKVADGDYCYLGMLEVDADHQRKGIGTEMLEDGIKYAQAHGCGAIVTIPDPDTNAIAFYLKCGFVKRRPIYLCTLPTKGDGATPLACEPIPVIPESVMEALPFVCGLAQTSPRHMWEICNHAPDPDKRFAPAFRLGGGGYAQISYFVGNDTGLALYWCERPMPADTRTLLAIGKQLGLERLEFRFFADARHLFPGAEINECDVELVRAIAD